MSAKDTSIAFVPQVSLAMRPTRTACRLSRMAKKARRYAEQGAVLRKARGARTFEQARAAIGVNSVQVVQNWEAGYNRPDPIWFGHASAFYGLPVGNLYTSDPIETHAEPTLKAQAIRPLLAQIRKNLDLLEVMVRQAAPDKKVEKAGYRKVKQTA